MTFRKISQGLSNKVCSVGLRVPDGSGADLASSCDRLKITRDTSFLLLRESEKLCLVTVTALTSRRVRLDGLYVQEPSTPLVRYARFSPPSTAEQRWFGAHAHDTACKGTVPYKPALEARFPGIGVSGAVF